MSVQNTNSQESFTLGGANETLPIPWKFIEADDLDVKLNGTLLVKDVGYTVAGEGEDNGGSVTMIGGAADDAVVVTRNTDLTQELDLLSNGDLPAESLEDAYDKGVLIDQELNRRVSAVEEELTEEGIEVIHDDTMTGKGTVTSPLSVDEEALDFVREVTGEGEYNRTKTGWVLDQGGGDTGEMQVLSDTTLKGLGITGDQLTIPENAGGLLDRSRVEQGEEETGSMESGQIQIIGPERPSVGWNGRYHAFPSSQVFPKGLIHADYHYAIVAWGNAANHFSDATLEMWYSTTYGDDNNGNDNLGKFWADNRLLLQASPSIIAEGGALHSNSIVLMPDGQTTVMFYGYREASSDGTLTGAPNYPNIYFRTRDTYSGSPFDFAGWGPEQVLDLGGEFSQAVLAGGNKSTIVLPDGSLVMTIYGPAPGGTSSGGPWRIRTYRLPPGGDLATGWVKVTHLPADDFTFNYFYNETVFLWDEATDTLESYTRRETLSDVKMTSTDYGVTWTGLHDVPRLDNCVPVRPDRWVDPNTGIGYLVGRHSRYSPNGDAGVLGVSFDRFETVHRMGYITGQRENSGIMYGTFFPSTNDSILNLVWSRVISDDHHQAPCVVERANINRAALGTSAGGGTGGGASSFTDLDDVFKFYAGRSGQRVVVRTDETGLTSEPIGGGPVTSDDTLDGDGFTKPLSALYQGILDRRSDFQIAGDTVQGGTVTFPLALALPEDHPGNPDGILVFHSFAQGAQRQFKLCLSTDRGETYGAPIDVTSLTNFQVPYRPCPAVNRATGEVMVIYSLFDTDGGQVFYPNVRIIRNTGGGDWTTWSAPEEINCTPALSTVFGNRLTVWDSITTANGMIIVGVWGTIAGNEAAFRFRILRSTDGGSTWTMEQAFHDDTAYSSGSGYNYPNFQETSPGNVNLVAAWPTAQKDYLIRSTDSGVTWPVEEFEIVRPWQTYQWNAPTYFWDDKAQVGYGLFQVDAPASSPGTGGGRCAIFQTYSSSFENWFVGSLFLNDTTGNGGVILEIDPYHHQVIKPLEDQPGLTNYQIRTFELHRTGAPTAFPDAPTDGAQYARESGAWQAVELEKETTPVLGGNLRTGSFEIEIQDPAQTIRGQIGATATTGAYFVSYPAGETWDPDTDGGIAIPPGQAVLFGAAPQVRGLGGGGNRQVYAGDDGVLYGVDPPAETEGTTSYLNLNHQAAADESGWEWLSISVPWNHADTVAEDAMEMILKLVMQNISTNRSGDVELGFTVTDNPGDAGDPASVSETIVVSSAFTGVHRISHKTTGIVIANGQFLNLWARNVNTSGGGFQIYYDGTTTEYGTHELGLYKLGEAGGGGFDVAAYVAPYDSGTIPDAGTWTPDLSNGVNQYCSATGAGGMTIAAPNVTGHPGSSGQFSINRPGGTETIAFSGDWGWDMGAGPPDGQTALKLLISYYVDTGGKLASAWMYPNNLI